jgi:nicotinamide mononucleotide adenylyltransferase
MKNCCINLRVRSKNYKKYLYCTAAKKVIDFDSCRNCVFKQMHKKKSKNVINNKSIMPKFLLLYGNNHDVIQCFNFKVNKGYHKHHIFEGKNRNNSEKYGLFVYVSWDDHILGEKALHENSYLSRILKKEAQRQFEKTYPELDFIKIFGQNYR